MTIDVIFSDRFVGYAVGSCSHELIARAEPLTFHV